MTYLSRPVFQLPLNWTDPVTKRFEYDLKEVALGFGSEYFTGLANSVVQGWEFSLDLRMDSDITAFDTFTAALSGRLVGFWLPAPIEGMQITAFVNSTTFDITAQGLASTWTDHPDVHLYFVNGATIVAAKITAVTDNGNGTERVVVNASLSSINSPLSALTVSRLNYVRLADDTETATYVADGWQKRVLRVVELPEEYTTYETGVKPIFLFHFWAAAPMDVHWYYTSFAGNVISHNLTYTKFSIEHGSQTSNMKGDAETIDISAQYDSSHPFALFLPIPFSRPLNVEIIETSFGAPDTVTRRFVGQVRSVEDVGDRLVAHCDSFLQILGRKAPRHLIGPDCPYLVYDNKTCKANRYEFETQGSIATLAAFDGTARPSLTVTLNSPNATREADDYFAQGFIETGSGLNYEMRVILASSWDSGTSTLYLELNAPLLKAIVGQTVQLIPGCDGSAATCKTKFNNYVNNGSFPFVPTENPTIASVNNNVAAGGKK